MIFAVSMTFIDQTIVSIAVPEIQKELGLSSTGVQWAVNAYLLSLAALFAFGGRLADTVGHRKMVVARRHHLRRGLDHVRAHPEGEPGRGVDRDLPGRPGCGRGHHVPGRPGHRGADLRPARAGQGPGRLLRHRRRPHRGRPHPRRLPHPVDVAGHLLGQHPGGHHRPGADRRVQADHLVQGGPDGLPGPGPDRLGCGASASSASSSRPSGGGATRASGCASPPAWSCWSSSTSSSCAPSRR